MDRRLVDTTNNTADAELSQANFDTNMIIILAALLCALICALGLNSFVRCILRCTRRSNETEITTLSTGLKKSDLRKIPIFVYGRDRDGNFKDKGEECPICLGEFIDGDKVRVLPKCNHGFHVRCIDTWLGGHSSCPNCRHPVVDSGPNDVLGPVGGHDHVVVEMGTFRS